MKYLLDTDVLIDNLRKKVKLKREIVEAGTATTIINVGELVYGAFKSKNPQKASEVVEDFLADLEIEIITLNKEIIYVFGKLKADLETKGQRLEDFDLLIASTAIAHSLTLVTNNIRHFSRIPNLQVAE